MHTFALYRDDDVFLPQHGMRTITRIADELVGTAHVSICTLQHYFSEKTERRATKSLIDGKVRAPASAQVAATALQQLREPPTKTLSGRWEKQMSDITALMRLGTLEKNILALRLLFNINQSAWSRSRLELYQKVLRCVVEESAYVFSETYEQTEKKILNTLVCLALERT